MGCFEFMFCVQKGYGYVQVYPAVVHMIMPSMLPAAACCPK